MKRMLLACAAALALTSQANASEWYFGLEAGVGSVDDTVLPEREKYLSKSLVVDTYDHYERSTTLSFKDGFAGFATLGKKYGNWRFEGELGYRQNDIDQIAYDGGESNYDLQYVEIGPRAWRNPGGELTEVTLMANVHRDFRLGGRWTASLGAGVGADFAEFTDPWNVSDSDAFFAAQGIAGISYAFNSKWSGVANYRYLWVNDPEFSTELFGGEIDLQKQAFTLGFRYNFGGPAPAPAPLVKAPAPVQAMQFIIYFAFDRCEITPAADNVLSEAAKAAKSTGSASVTIVGHTDTMGSNEYNEKLSLCRANAAGDNLVAKGVPAAAIATSGKGETELTISTGDGVKEPQNRRASVDVN